MKTRAFFLTALVAAMLSAASAHAGEHTRSETGGKLGVGGGAVIGAVIGGPASAIVGAGLGGFLGDRLQLAASVDDLQASLESSRSENEDLGVVLDAEREAAVIAARRAEPGAVLLPVVLPTMHVAWGTGFLFGSAKAEPACIPLLTRSDTPDCSE
mgnify:CR=1 FL=1